MGRFDWLSAVQVFVPLINPSPPENTIKYGAPVIRNVREMLAAEKKTWAREEEYYRKHLELNEQEVPALCFEYWIF